MKLSKPQQTLIVVGIAALGLIGFIAAKVTAPKPAPTVPTAVAKVANVEHAVLATGSLQPSNVVDVGAEVSGRVIELKVRLGDRVNKGDIIARIDPTRLANDVQQQENNIRQAESSLRDRLAQLELARMTAERQKTLFEKGAGSAVQAEQQQANYLSRIAQTDNQRQQIENQKIELERRKGELAKATVRAPIDGIVAEVITHQGDTINVFRDAPVLVKLAQTDVMTVRAQVSEADIGKVQPGQTAYFTILGQPDKRRYATVKSREIAAAGVSLDPDSRQAPQAIYYNVVFETPNADEELLPSMTAEVHVVLGEAQNVLTVPVAALTPGEGGKTAVRLVESDGDVVERPVQVGVSNNFVAEIRGGLKAGDRVLLADQPAAPKS